MPVAKPPRWKPQVLQKMSVPFGAVKLTASVGDIRSELVVGRIVVAERAPRPEVVKLAAGCGSRDIFERAGVLVDVDEVEKRLQQVAVVEIAMPALGGAALCPV